jgi:hypothetical protein
MIGFYEFKEGKPYRPPGIYGKCLPIRVYFAPPWIS